MTATPHPAVLVMFGILLSGCAVIIGALFAGPTEEDRRAANTIRAAAREADVTSAARDAALRSPALTSLLSSAPDAPNRGSDAAAARLAVEVIAIGVDLRKNRSATPFVALRTRLRSSATGRVMYESTQD